MKRHITPKILNWVIYSNEEENVQYRGICIEDIIEQYANKRGLSLYKNDLLPDVKNILRSYDEIKKRYPQLPPFLKGSNVYLFQIWKYGTCYANVVVVQTNEKYIKLVGRNTNLGFYP